MDKDKQIQNTPSKGQSHLVRIAEQIKDKIITKPNCKLCTSKYRAAAEIMYENTNRNFRAVQKLLDKNNESISYHAIRNHFKTHYEQQKMDLLVKEYIDNVAKFRVENQDRRSALEERKTMLEQHMIQLAAMGQGAVTSEDMRKDATALKMLSDAILAIDKELSEMDKKLEPVFIVIEIITKIIHVKIKNSKSQEHKDDLTDILDQLSEQTKDLIVEK